MKLGRTIIYVADVAATVAFYEAQQPGDTAPGFELCLVSDGPDGAFAQAVSAGAIAEQPVAEKPWGQRVGYVRGLNGVLVELCSTLASS